MFDIINLDVLIVVKKKLTVRLGFKISFDNNKNYVNVYNVDVDCRSLKINEKVMNNKRNCPH